MPWMSAVTAIRVVVARIIPSSVRKLRSLFLRKESTAMRPASQKEALGRNWDVRDAMIVYGKDARGGAFVPAFPSGQTHPDLLTPVERLSTSAPVRCPSHTLQILRLVRHGRR